MMTSENAPSRRGMMRTIASSSDRSASRASSSAMTSVSLLGRSARAEAVAVRAAGQRLGQDGGVGEVAVVGQGDPAPGGVGLERRLGVLPAGAAGGRVAGVADRQVPLEGGQRRLVEDLADQAHLLVDEHAAPVGDGHAGRLLATVLEGVEPVEDEVGDLLPRSPHPEDPARLAWMVGVEHVPPGPDSGPSGGVGKRSDRSTGPRRSGGCSDAPVARLLVTVIRNAGCGGPAAPGRFPNDPPV